METPVLTKYQRKQTLSAKKTPNKGLKNVLVHPTENYWPLLKNDHGAALENLLKKSLTVLKKEKLKLPWGNLRKMSKEQRRAAREALKLDENSFDKDISKCILFGVNVVTRALEKKDVCCVLIDSNIDPIMLVKHVAELARINSIPVLIVNFLKRITLNTIGFSSAALALKNDVSNTEDNHFNKLYSKVFDLFMDLPIKIPQKSLFQLDETAVNNLRVSDDLVISNDDNNVKKDEKPSISRDVYLYRTGTDKRIFVPKDTLQKKKKAAKWGDFISLNSNNGDDFEITQRKKLPPRFFMLNEKSSEPEENKTKKSQSHNVDKNKNQETQDQGIYVPLKVKRLQGNPFRVKATKVPKVKKK